MLPTNLSFSILTLMKFMGYKFDMHAAPTDWDLGFERKCSIPSIINNHISQGKKDLMLRQYYNRSQIRNALFAIIYREMKGNLILKIFDYRRMIHKQCERNRK